VRLVYRARFGADPPGTPTRREADPYGLARVSGIWYLVAHCHLRGAVRNFRLDRIESVELLARHFERPPGFVLALPSDERPLRARVLIDPAAAPWVREAPPFYATAMEERAGGLLVTLHLRRHDELLPWLLGLGRHAQVLEPMELRELLLEEARGILDAHDSLLT
jgi:predicted DNA-binding transcriptional regulator YafY